MSNKVVVKLMTNLINKRFYDSKDEAIAKLDVYFAMMEEYWKDHLPLQYQKLHHRKELIIDDYYCVVVSDDADKIIDKVKELLEA